MGDFSGDGWTLWPRARAHLLGADEGARGSVQRRCQHAGVIQEYPDIASYEAAYWVSGVKKNIRMVQGGF